MLESREIFIIFCSSFGTVYRSIFTTTINTIKKFMGSLVFSTVGGMILIYYCKENVIQDSTAIMLALVIGLISHNLGQILIGVGDSSEKGIIASATKYIITKTNIILSNTTSTTNTTTSTPVSGSPEPAIIESNSTESNSQQSSTNTED